MKVRVETVHRCDDGLHRVMFSAPIGSGRAIWRGGVAQKGHTYDVEFDITESLEIGTNAGHTAASGYRISATETEVVMIGRVEDIDQDGLIFLRLSRDCIIMVDSASQGIQAGQWITLRISAENLELTPQGG